MANTVELFTLRLWQQAAGTKPEWRGKIQHIRSGEARYFRDWHTLENFLLETAPKLEGSGFAGKPPGQHVSSRRVGKVKNSVAHGPSGLRE